MAEGARIAEAAGADIIDINMGCPAKHVTGGQSGSALMRDLDHALTLIDATVGAVSVPVTLKMRLGWDDASRNAPELARRAEAAGVAAHHRAWPHALPVLQGLGRLGRGPRRQAGGVDSGRRQRRRDELRRGASTALAQSGADAVMVGRGAQGRPWFPGQLAHYLATGETSAPIRRSTQQLALVARALRRDARPSRRAHRRAPRAQASRLGARCGRARRPALRAEQLKAARAHVLTAEDPAEAQRRLADGLRRRSAGGRPHEPRRTASCPSATRPPTPCSTRCRIRS